MRTHAVKTTAENQHEKNIIEEYVLENSCLNLRPVEYSRHYPMPKAPRFKTVSIIETLSELARGEIDREDSGNVFLPVNNLSLLPEIQRAQAFQECSCHHQAVPSKSRTCKANENIKKRIESLKNNNNVHSKSRSKNYGNAKSNIDDFTSMWVLSNQERSANFGQEKYFGFSHASSKRVCPSLVNHYNQSKIRSGNFHKLQLPYFAARPSTNLFTTSAKQKETSEMVRHRSLGSRHCFSDSEIDGFEFEATAVGKPKARNKCTSHDCLGPRLSPDCVEHFKGKRTDEKQTANRSTKYTTRECKSKVRTSQKKKNKVPEWISSIFRIAKEGKLEKIKISLKDMDDALVRNLSDCNGNNLWHIACNNNHLSCVQWLCAQFGQVALVDENKHGLTPVVSAVKKGSFLVLQWLLQKKYDQGLGIPSEGKRSLLHYAAKYGQVEMVQWLVRYYFDMNYNLNSKDSDGNTALHLAAKYGHIQCVKYITLEGGDLTERNNFGYRPYDMAASNKQQSCSEYLIALEACFSLAAGSYLLESDLQRFQCESINTRKNFKELQQLMRTSIYHQKELLETFQAVCRESQLLEEEANEQSAESEKGEEQSAIRQGFQNRLKEEFNRWYSTAVLKDEATFHLLEEKWRQQSRRNSKHVPDNKSPLHIVRSQFAQVSAKASSLNQMVDISISLSDSSLSEESSDEELDPEAMPPFLEDVHLNELLKSSSAVTTPVRNVASKLSSRGPKLVSLKCSSLSPAKPSSKQNRRISLPVENLYGASLQMLFEKNPELKQEGQTCSVLEVLEPSSSDNEEASRHEIGSSKVSKSENATPHLQRVSDLVKLLEESQVATSCKQTYTKSKGHSFPWTGGTREALLLEPPLSVTIAKTSESLVRSNEGLQKSNKNRTHNEKNPKRVDEKNAHDSNEERSASSADVSLQDSTEAGESILENSTKKRSFLLKFSLKNRWSSKQKRHTKKPEEKVLTEHKADAEKPLPSSQFVPADFRNNAIAVSEEKTHVSPATEANILPKACDRIIPKRRDPPPPIPEDFHKEIMDNMDIGFSVDSLNTSSKNASSADAVVKSRQFHSSPGLYDSAVKLDSRPPSSASRVDAMPRSEDSFKVVGLPLRKTLSASVELLVTPDCSTAGRQSPAHSEVSKTESALSPPSDVSKTESTRHLNHLDKIEERTIVKKPVEIIDMVSNEEAKNENSLCYEVPVEQQKNTECRKLDKTPEPSSKPWYEVSDDEDLLGPRHFQGTVRNNSEDEASEMLL